MNDDTKGKSKLLYLKRNYYNLARKDSISWVTGRQTRFGGCEIGKIIKRRHKSVIKSKISAIKFKPKRNLYCAWGLTFEEVAKIYLKHQQKLEIFEFGAIPSSQLPIAYSPDGVFINPKDDDLWLLEIKCPFSRHLDDEKSISSEYIHQVQSGMNILPCDKTKFIQFKFRRCREVDVSDPQKYSRRFHRDFRKHDKEKDMLWWGVLIWKTNEGYRERFLETKPDIILCSFKDDMKTIENMTDITITFFKCFYIKEETIHKDQHWIKNNEHQIWKSYNKLMESYNNYLDQ